MLNDRTGKLRRSFYLRSLALSSREAKETRVFDLCAWLIEGYRRNAHAVLREVWTKRNEGWLAAVVLVIVVGAAELLTLWVIANDSIAGRIDLSTTAWRRRIAAVFQDFARFELSAYDNVAFGALHAFDEPDKVARTARRADRIVVVEHGRIVEDGAHADLVRRRGGRYAALYALQAARFEASEVVDA